MKYPVYSQSGEKIGETLLPKEVFGVKTSPDLLWQVVRAYQANQRQTTAHTKTRGEVRGGGRKPWRQKGTGRARASSLRSPLFRGGGTVFGPTSEKDYRQKINQKAKKLALRSALSLKAKDKEMVIVENLHLENSKTKTAAAVMKNFQKGKTLLVLPEKNELFCRALNNLSGLKVVEALNLNALEILTAKTLVLTKESLKKIRT